MGIVKINNHTVCVVKPKSFSEINMKEKDLQGIIKRNPSVLGEKLLIVGEELAPFKSEGSKKRLDLFALDADGNRVVIELKRDEDGFHMDLQAIRYASIVSLFTIEKICEFYCKFHQCDEEVFKEDVAQFLDVTLENYAEKLNTNQDSVRIILVNKDFSKEITNTVLWLNEQGLNIKCIKILPYEIDDIKLLDIDTIIPVKEVEDYQISLKEQKNSDRKTLKKAKDATKYFFNNKVNLGKRHLVLEIIKFYVNQNPKITLDKLQKIFPMALRQGSLQIVSDINDINDDRRYFIKDNELLILHGKKVTVCNQWGVGNIEPFIDYVTSKLGYKVEIMN